MQTAAVAEADWWWGRSVSLEAATMTGPGGWRQSFTSADGQLVLLLLTFFIDAEVIHLFEVEVVEVAVFGNYPEVEVVGNHPFFGTLRWYVLKSTR
jgi:hypothetical protein